MPIRLLQPLISRITATFQPNDASTLAASPPQDWFSSRPVGSVTAPPTPSTGGLSPLSVRTWAPPPAFPQSAGLGVQTIHRYEEPRVAPSTIAVTVHTPIPTAGVPGTLLDTNSKPFTEPLSARFIIGDGGTTRAFTGVDLTVSSELDQILDAIILRMPKQPDGTVSQEDAIEFMRSETNNIIRWTRGSSMNDGRAEFAWDRALQIGPQARTAFERVAFQNVGDPAEPAGQDLTVVGLERYVQAGEGYCIQKALLAACVLGKLGVPLRIVNGAVSQAPGRTTGHTWLELQDGRILDVAWGRIDRPVFDHATHRDWFRFGSSYRFANQRYPYMSLV